MCSLIGWIRAAATARSLPTFAVVAVAMLVAAAGAGGWAGYRLGHTVGFAAGDAAGHDRGVDECEAAHAEAAHRLNLALQGAQDAADSAAVDVAIQAEMLAELERKLADERQADPLASGRCITDDGLRRIFSIPGAR